MVQPTNKSVIGSNLREDSIKKREFANFKGYTKMDNPAVASLLRLSLDSLGVYTISLAFSPLHLLLSSSLVSSDTQFSTPL